MTDTRKQVVIIGAGHNGLTCAAYLAKAGFEVNVLEASTRTGGAASTQEFADGFRVSSGAHLLYQLSEEISEELALEEHGLKLAADSLDTVALDPNGDHLTLSGDNVTGNKVSQTDHDAMVQYRKRMLRFSQVFADLNALVPPRLATSDRSETLSLAHLAWKVRRLGKTEMREFLRIVGINIHDVLEENFENELLKGALSLDGVLGSHLGPRSNNTVFTALHRLGGSVKGVQGAMAVPRGGMGTVSEALKNAALAHGVSILHDARVAQVEINGDRATGVSLPSGEMMPADYVISSLDPKTTLLDLLGARYLDAGLVRRITHIRHKGNAAKLHLALDSLPEFTGLKAEQLGQRLVIAPDMDYVEKAFNPVKYGEPSVNPVMEITIPTVHDASLAPAGQHVMSAIVQYVPHDSHARKTLEKTIMKTLAKYAPGIGKQVIESELLLPADLEERFGNAGGHWHHAELALDQFMMLRPATGLARYKSPIDGLYLCGAGCHPGGGVMGHAGRNAARVIIGEEN